MARQAGEIQLTGRIGNTSFYKHKEFGFLARRAGGASKSKIKKSPTFARVRENNSEFGSASSTNKMIKEAFAPLRARCRDGSFHNRLMGEVCELVKGDSTSERGKREVKKHVAKQLTHVELNRNCFSRKFFELPVSAEVEEGLHVEATIKIKHDDLPLYWNVSSQAVSIDFQTKKITKQMLESDIFLTEKGKFEVMFDHTVDVGGALFHGMCINFYHVVDDEFVMINDPELMAGFMRCVG